VSRLLALLCILAAVLLAAPVPVLDEESYLAIADQLDIARPYHWWRPWPPWDGSTEPDAFVYAHPPLFLQWVAMCRGLGLGELLSRVVAAVPLAALFGLSAAKLVTGMSKRPTLAAAAWLASPVVLLGLQRGLMPDLMVAALGTAAVAGWREGSKPGAHKGWLLSGGLALGLAALTKYPALALVPVLLVHGGRLGLLRRTWVFWLAAAVPWCLGEAWLVGVYGRLHLWEVLSRASEISRGTGPGRALGVLVRLPIGVAVLALLTRGHRWLWIPAFILAAGVGLWAWPMDLSLGARVQLFAWSIAGAGLVCLATAAAWRGWRTLDPDTLLLGLWASSVIGSVWLAHNFAAPRYLLPAVLPLVLLLVRAVGDLPEGRVLLWTGVSLQLAGGVVLTHAEHRYSEAGATLADEVITTYGSQGYYTGEWSFRWRMEAHGWTFYTGDAPAGAVVVAPTHGSPGELPQHWERLGDHRVDGSLPIRVVDDPHQVGLYAETLGALPLGWGAGPIEEVVAWRVR
jgi:4-amino-4-deoxy-L-arabinose transferase-like glycosyltransferase